MFCIAIIAYLVDTVSQSMAIENLIFVLPLSLTTLTLGVVIIYKNIRSTSFSPSDEARDLGIAVSSDARPKLHQGDTLNQYSRSLTLMGLFAAFVFLSNFWAIRCCFNVFHICRHLCAWGEEMEIPCRFAYLRGFGNYRFI